MTETFFIIIFGIASWWVASQVIAYVIVPEPKDAEEVREMWAVVFMAPPLISLLFLAKLYHKLQLLMYQRGLHKKPDDYRDLL